MTGAILQIPLHALLVWTRMTMFYEVKIFLKAQVFCDSKLISCTFFLALTFHIFAISSIHVGCEVRVRTDI